MTGYGSGPGAGARPDADQIQAHDPLILHTDQWRLDALGCLGSSVGKPLSRLDIAITEHERWTSVRSSTHHYVVHDDGRELLWDMIEDPNEHHELTQATNPGPSVMAALNRHRHLLLQRQLQARRELPRTYPY